MQIDLLAYPEGTRYGIDRSRTAENCPFEAAINDSAVFDVVIRKPSADTYGQNDKNSKRDPDHWVASKKPLAACRALLSLRKL